MIATLILAYSKDHVYYMPLTYRLTSFVLEPFTMFYMTLTCQGL